MPLRHIEGSAGTMTSRAPFVLKLLCLLVCWAHVSSAQTLTVNKYQFAGDAATVASVNACVNTNQGTNVGSCASQIFASTLGSPVLYVVAITNSGASGTGTVYDALPTPGFQLTS